MVIAGGHRDAWGPGAADNVSGVVSVLEMARWLLTRFEAADPADWTTAPAPPAAQDVAKPASPSASRNVPPIAAPHAAPA